jgi:transcriptional regulator with XRE-family HTH domain
MECSELLEFIGRRIRSLRKEKRLSQERLSELAGLHPTSLSDIERGKVNGFICNYFNLAVALDVSLADLVDKCTDADNLESMRQTRTLIRQIQTLDPKKRAVYLDAASKLFERIDAL